MIFYRLKAKPTGELYGLFLERLQFACRPAPYDFIVRQYTTALALCATRKQDDQDQELSTAAICERMRYYPADVVSYALDTWPDSNQFRPTWNELRCKLDSLSEDRLKMLRIMVADNG
jgi:hypothetical protein